MSSVSCQGRLDTQGGDSMPGMSQQMLDIPVPLSAGTEKQFEAIRRDTFTITFSRCCVGKPLALKRFHSHFTASKHYDNFLHKSTVSLH